MQTHGRVRRGGIGLQRRRRSLRAPDWASAWRLVWHLGCVFHRRYAILVPIETVESYLQDMDLNKRGYAAVILPLFTYTAKLNKAYFLVRAFAGGVVLVTGFVHVLGDAIPLLADPCLGLSTEFPWALVFTSFAAMFAFMLEWSLTQYFKRKLVPDVVEPKPEELESGLDMLDDKELERRRLRYVVISTTFEAGVIFHSIFIGITIGISSSADTVRSLMIALMFHQACEGLALGVTFVKAEYSVLKYCLLGLLFLVITPLGIAIGMGVGNSYQAQSKIALGFEGGFNSLSAGILIYNGLVDLIVPTFSPEELPVQSWLQGLGFICMFAGGAVMSLIAKWA